MSGLVPKCFGFFAYRIPGHHVSFSAWVPFAIAWRIGPAMPLMIVVFVGSLENEGAASRLTTTNSLGTPEHMAACTSPSLLVNMGLTPAITEPRYPSTFGHALVSWSSVIGCRHAGWNPWSPSRYVGWASRWNRLWRSWTSSTELRPTYR